MNPTDHMTRRTAMAVGVASVGLAGLKSRALDQPDDAYWVDAHSHVWPPETDRFQLAHGLSKKDLDPPSFTDDELMAIAGPEGVRRVVLIQHSIYHAFDNSYLLDVVRRHPQRFRCVGMVDDTQPGAGAAMKRLLPRGVTGFRITPFFFIIPQRQESKVFQCFHIILVVFNGFGKCVDCFHRLVTIGVLFS